ncbi:hypothetical protein [Nonomuraea sp. JJY05]|uniref:hypothetical protein n=1 Tax=Nonomuraea sp. JJY05 TaxID=3350255 RepID=UPI00373E0C15
MRLVVAHGEVAAVRVGQRIGTVDAQWIPYAPVTRLDDAVRRETELGATVVRPRVDFAAGSVIVIQDPNGATLALWESHA